MSHSDESLLAKASTTLPTFAKLGYFLVSVNVNRQKPQDVKVYANGRQQCEVTVTALAQDANGNLVPLSAEHMRAAVRLIHHDGGSAIAHDSEPSSDGWRTTFAKGAFTWDPDGIERNAGARSPQGAPEPSPQIADDGKDDESDVAPYSGDSRLEHATSIVFYLSTTKINDVAGTAIGAQIQSSIMVDPVKTNSSVPSDDGYGVEGRFNSQVNVYSFGVPDYKIGRFGTQDPKFKSDYILEDGEKLYSSNNNLRVYEHYLYLRRNDGSLVDLISARSDTSDTQLSIWKHSGEDNNTEWTYTYLGQPGSRTLNHSSEYIGYFTSGQGSKGNVWTSISLVNKIGGKIFNARLGQVVIGQIMGNDHLQIRDWNRVLRDLPSRNLYLRDEYGNDHRVAIYLPNKNLNYIAIRKW